MERKNALSTVATVLLASGLIIGGAYAYQEYRKNSGTEQPAEQVSEQGNPPAVPEDWSRFNSDRLGLSLRHPRDVQTGETEQGLTVYQWGPTQVEGTEVYDGMLVNLRRIALAGKTLEQEAQAKVEEWKVHGQITEQLSRTTVAGKQGYMFKATSLGDYTMYYLPAGNGDYIEIGVIAEDPKAQGFEQTVRTMLGSLDIR